MNKEEEKRLKDAEKEVIHSRAAQTQAQKERDLIQKEADSLRSEKDYLMQSLKDNMSHVDELNKQLQDFVKDYNEVVIDLEKTRNERDLLKTTLQEIVDLFGGTSVAGRFRYGTGVEKVLQNAVSILAGDKPPNVRPTPTERKRAREQKRKERLNVRQGL